MERVAHKSAVQLFRLAGDTVRLSVQQGMLAAIKVSGGGDRNRFLCPRIIVASII